MTYSIIIQEVDLEPFTNQNNKTKGTGLKILTLKEILQRLSRTVGQVKTDNKSESLLNEIR